MRSARLPDSAGHDIIVWQKGPQTPTWVIGYSGAGIKYVKTFIPDYVGGKTELAGIYPDEFLDKAPKGLRIGAVVPGTRKTITLLPRPLH